MIPVSANSKVKIFFSDFLRELYSYLPSDPAGAFNWFGIVLAAVLYVAIKKWNRHPVMYIAASAAVGIAAGYLNLFG